MLLLVRLSVPDVLTQLNPSRKLVRRGLSVDCEQHCFFARRPISSIRVFLEGKLSFTTHLEGRPKYLSQRGQDRKGQQQERQGLKARRLTS